MEATVYLDNSATTRPIPEVIRCVCERMEQSFYNPSAVYTAGLDAENDLNTARQTIADKLGCHAEELYFTSGATEANNLAVFGAAQALMRRGKHIVTTALEHPSVYEPMRQLEEMGFEITWLTGKTAGVSEQQILEALRPDTVLVSVMKVNNELGTVSPIDQIGSQIKQKAKHALVHCDAAQAAGKVPVDIKQLDLLTLSGHKLHAPKGIGVLYIKKGVRLRPLFYGGGQEKGLRPGTEPTALIAGLAAAFAHMAPFDTLAKTLKQQLIDGLKNLQGAVVNSPVNAAPHIVNFSLPGYQSETLIHFLDKRGIFVSGGAACYKGKRSRVLIQAGLPDEQIASALRVSFCKDNTRQDVKRLLDALQEAQTVLARSTHS